MAERHLSESMPSSNAASGFEQKEIVLALTPEEKVILESLPVPLAEERVLELKRIAQTIAGDLTMKVTVGRPGEGSFFDPRKTEITLDPMHIAEHPEMARMVSAHEGAHRRLTRSPKALGIKPELIDELYGRALGFAYLANSIEDPAVNNWTKKEFAGLRPDFDKTYSGMLAKEHIPLGLDHPEVQEIVRRTGTIPNLVWVGSELIRYWHTRRFSKGIKKIRPKATEVLAKVLKPSAKAFKTLPEQAYYEPDVLDQARERFRIVYEEVWPQLEPLVQEDKENEARRRMMEEEMKHNMEDKGLEGMAEDLEKGKTGTPLDDLPDDLRKELAEAMKQAAARQKESVEREAEDLKNEAEKLEREREEIERLKKELKEKQKQAQGKEADKLKQEKAKLKAREEMSSAKKNELAGRQEKNERAKKAAAAASDLPLEMNDLSEELHKELAEAFETLPPDEQARLREEAEQALNDLEDALNKNLESKINPDRPESHEEYEERKDEEKNDERSEQERKKEFEKMKQRAKELARAGRTEYDTIRAEMDDVTEDLYGRLEAFFIRERHPKWRKGFKSGPKLTLLRAMEFASGAKPEAYGEMFERKTAPTRFEYKFSLVVDLSGSMNEADKIQETQKGLIVLTEVLNRLGIDFEILGFNSMIGVQALKDFEKDYDEAAQENVARAPERVGGGTPTADAIREAYQHIKERAAKDNYVIVLTDGGPDSVEDTKDSVREILHDEETPVKIVGVGLGRGTGFVKDLFPSAIGDIAAKDIPESLTTLLEQMIENPELFELGEEARERFTGET